MNNAIYQDIRVLDLSTNIAGPLIGMSLGDLGADVIKIEKPPYGDDTRALPPQHESGSSVFTTFNRNKRSLCIDIRSDQGKRVLKKLVESADVVIESFPPGFADIHGYLYDDFKKINPAIILCSVSAFGEKNIGKKMPGYDALVQSVSGMMSFTGHPNQDPVRVAPSILDISTGMWGVINTMAALKQREDSPAEGRHVTVSLIDSAFTMMSHQITSMLVSGQPPEPLGSGAPSAAPYRVFNTKNGRFMLATASQAQFVRLCHALSMPALIDKPEFSTMDARIANRVALDTILQEHFQNLDIENCLNLLSSNGISVGKVNRLDEALSNAVAIERDIFIAPESIGWAGGIPLIKSPVGQNFSQPYRRPPTIGEHNDEILKSLEINKLSLTNHNNEGV
ncbi:CoA transferase [Zhongshania sp.]|jgi:crotonobetainyl-CoA:carnitine CoA-transferase CaiB-like acyl-CoA transferase|uniref:CaiB/BaiF CoA transferase family protein n=1 Tax=Zhongshania sp. TaxID=1971902 RepID=UPI002A7ED30C|nr:CoA transferase [Zhongshania sp.]